MMVNLPYLLSRRSQFRVGFSAEAICFDTYKFLLSLMAFPIQKQRRLSVWCWPESEKWHHGDWNRLPFDFPT
jgi:hypothetical protein